MIPQTWIFTYISSIAKIKSIYSLLSYHFGKSFSNINTISISNE